MEDVEMNEIMNIARNNDFAMDTQMPKGYESNLERAKVVKFLRKLGMRCTQNGTIFIADIVCYCLNNRIYSIKNLRAFYNNFANLYYSFNEQETKQMMWNIEDSIEYLENSLNRNDELLCSFLFEFRFDKTISPKQFFTGLLGYLHTEYKIFEK